ncbi:MAG: hypothetical protein Q8P86_03410 [bacterium]|nr:hypothetical protein [bacterium]
MEPKVNLKITNINLSSEDRGYFFKRLSALSKVLDFGDPTLIIDAELGKTTNRHQKGDIFFSEINVNFAHNKFRSRVEKDDLKSAIDESKEEILNELSRNKSKNISLLRRGGQRLKALVKGLYGRRWKPWKRK